MTEPSFIVRPLAERDIHNAALWYERERPGLGTEFVNSIEECFDAVRENPSRFPIVYRDVHRALAERFPFAVYYVVREDRVQVIACMHGRRHPRRWQQRAGK